MSELNSEIPTTKKNLKIPEGITSSVITSSKGRSRLEQKKYSQQIKTLRIMGKLGFCHTHELVSKSS